MRRVRVGNHAGNGRGQRSWTPWGVLVAALVVTTFATLYVARTLAAREQLHFNNSTRVAQDRIAARIDTYVTMLRATDGLFCAHYPVFKPEFERYCDQLDLRNRYPGIQGIGYSFRYDPAGLVGFEGFVRYTGEKDFKVHPLHNLDQHYAIVFLEPQDVRNRKAIGYDMYSEPVRRAAMQQARDTGRPCASGKVQLVQEIDDDKQSGFLIYLPVYKGGQVPPTAEERKEKIIAFVYAPFRCGDLLESTLVNQLDRWLDFEIYDGDRADPAALLFRSSSAPPSSPRLTATVPFQVEGRNWTMVFRTRPEFRTFWAAAAVPVTGLGGGLLSLVLFLVTRAQVVGRVRAERLLSRLRKSKVALRRSETRFRRLYDSNIVGVVFTTGDRKIIEGNDAYFRIIGRSRQDVLKKDVDWHSMIAPDHFATLSRAVSQLEKDGVAEPYEIDLLRPDGSRVSILSAAAALGGADGGIIAILIDITGQKEAERDLRAAKEAAELAQEQAESANRLKDEFLATVSHELRTPLNAILGWTQLLRSSSSSPDDLVHGLETIERNARAQAQLVDDLLDVSRIVAGKLRVEMHPVDLANVIEAAVQTIRPTADVKGVALDLEAPKGRCIVAGDAARLGQVVWNLLSNAVKFTPRDGIVTIRLDRDHEQARITVRDTGKGIDPDFLPYVFERFRQADSSSTRKYGGLGLGLGIVRHLVQLHGGSVEAHSAGDNQGATFIVCLPLSREHIETTPRNGNGEGNGVLRGIHVLLVEDEQDARELLQRFLSRAGAHVSVADSARQALELYELKPPHILVSDISMPDEDGYVMLRKMRKHPSDHRVPAIAVTAYARPEDRERAFQAGYEVHLTKPVQAQELVTTVARLVSR